MRISWGKVRLEPFRRSANFAKSEKVDHHEYPRLRRRNSDNDFGGQQSMREASDEASSSSASSREGNPEEQFFSVDDKLLFPLSSISISPQELRSVSIDENKQFQEFPIRQVHDYESEDETISRTSTSDSEVTSQEKRDKFVGLIKKLKKGPTSSLHKTFNQTLPTINSFKKSFIKKHSRRSDERKSMPNIPPQIEGEEIDFSYCFQSSWKNFTLSELKQATDNFSEANLIGEGGYSSIYKGTLDYGQLVAVKKLRGSQEETTSDYLSELGILVHVNHPNIASVIGYGVEDGMHLVLPLSPHGSLECMLKGQKEKLSWSCRYQIALGVAFGLAYLHEGCQRRIIHRDIKSANILLTEDLEAQICDFGLAKWLPEQWTHLTVSQYEGTFGYLPPEYFLHGFVDEKTDVYSYGVVLLELLSGRPAIDESHNSVVMWAKPLLINKDIEKLIDPSLANSYDLEQVNRMINVAMLCIHQTPTERPQMSKAATMLQGDEGLLQSKGRFPRRPPILKRSSHLEINNNRVKSLDLDS